MNFFPVLIWIVNRFSIWNPGGVFGWTASGFIEWV